MSKIFASSMNVQILFFLLSIAVTSVADAQTDQEINEIRRHAQQSIANPQQLKYQIVDVQEKDGIFTIIYNLDASLEDEYSVDLILFRDRDTLFKIKPITLNGDIGRGNYSGNGRKIIWDSRKDLKQTLVGNDFYFVLYITKIEPSRFPWMWVGVGGVAAGAAILLLSHKSSSEPGSTELPAISVSRP